MGGLVHLLQSPAHRPTSGGKQGLVPPGPALLRYKADDFLHLRLTSANRQDVGTSWEPVVVALDCKNGFKSCVERECLNNLFGAISLADRNK